MPPNPGAPVRVCFVCLGNICRSPSAEAVFRALVEAALPRDTIHIDSAGTAAYHVGNPPDARSREAAARRGIDVSGAARHFVAGDFDRFEYVIAMDRANLRDLEELAPNRAARARIHLLRQFESARASDRSASQREAADVPDPYYGGADGFDRVLDICEAACAGLLADVIREHGLRAQSPDSGSR